MIRVFVETKTNGQFTPNSASRWVEDLAQTELARWQLACALDTGGEIRVRIDGEPSVLYASLADVPRPVLRVYWRVVRTYPRGVVRLGSRIKKYTTNERKDALTEAEAMRIASPDSTVTVTRVTVRPKRAR